MTFDIMEQSDKLVRSYERLNFFCFALKQLHAMSGKVAGGAGSV